jgi:filamentous hemagglutinin family protein
LIRKLFFPQHFSALFLLQKSRGVFAQKLTPFRLVLSSIKILFSALFIFSSIALSYAQNNPRALPSGGKVVAGSAVITQSGLQTNVNQSSQRAVVNWDSFNVGKDASVNFNQPNASAVTLNRVTGGSASVIDGAIRANGQVILVNPNGVTFGRGAEINAAGVVASTMNISDKDFMDAG